MPTPRQRLEDYAVDAVGTAFGAAILTYSAAEQAMGGLVVRARQTVRWAGYLWEASIPPSRRSPPPEAQQRQQDGAGPRSRSVETYIYNHILRQAEELRAQRIQDQQRSSSETGPQGPPVLSGPDYTVTELAHGVVMVTQGTPEPNWVEHARKIADLVEVMGPTVPKPPQRDLGEWLTDPAWCLEDLRFRGRHGPGSA